jgi:branched-subunit amino acid aminotransferase/4-amino-4-deoxychorismate lyase
MTGGQFADGCAWIEGDYVPIAEARIPILDAGFVRSDLTYDVVGVWHGRFFRLEDHLTRLEEGCAKIRLALPMARDEIREIMVEVVRRSGLREAYVEAVVTRGVPSPGERDPRRWTPRLYVYAIPYVWIVRPELQWEGTKVVVAEQTRRIPPDSVDPTVKNFHWGDLVRGLFEAYDRDAWLPILSDGDGHVTEGPGFNVFAAANGVLHTPELGVLEGITRRTAIEIARDQGVEVRLEEMPVPLLYEADEIFLTSTAGGVMPVAMLDGKPVGSGAPGPVTTAIRDRYWELHDDPRYTLAVDYEPRRTAGQQV